MTLAPPPTSILNEGSLFLDFDGTLVTFADRPDAVRMEPSLIEVLAHLHTLLDGRLAILTGRSIADVREFLAPLDLAVAGSHGLERAGAKTTIESSPPSHQLNQAIEHLRDFAADRPGILVEEKPRSVALHYRAAPGMEDECFEAAQRTAMSTGFTIQPGSMVLELKPACSDKGTALEQFMDEAPFRGSRPVFLGDDLTDEHGFLAARRLGGVGVLVGEYRETAAGFLLENVGAVHDWLRAAIEDFK